MNVTVFITLAYGAAGTLLAALWIASWMRARHVRRQLGRSPGL